MKCPQCQADNPSSSRFCGLCASPLPQSGEPRISQTETFEGPPPDLERGQLFAGRYEVIEEIGSGGMGKVYKVYDKKIQDTIALKLIRPELAARPKTLERFREEIRLSRKITHKHVCRMHDLNEEQEIPYITMEYVHGEDLKSVIRMMGRLSPAQTVFLGKQLCEGLGEAHKLGIIHRDLKPKNIMVDRDGNARIMDFGLARCLEEKGITGGRVIVGTAEYMSPEQVEGKAADLRSDIYSLGVILFEMVTGKLPFDGDSALSIAVKHRTDLPPDPRRLNPQVPEALSKIILRCLEKTGEKRYQTTQELCAALSELEKEFPSAEKVLPQKRPSGLSGLTRTVLRKKVLAPVIAVLILAAGTIIVWRSLRREPIFVPTGKPSLAVLPFENMNRDPGLDLWETALAKLSIEALRQDARQITVLSSAVVETAVRSLEFEKKTSFSSKDLQALGAKLRVSHLLTANYLKVMNDFRVLYELKEAKTGNVVGSGGVDKTFEKIMTVPEDLAASILSDFKLQAPPQPSTVATVSTQAFRYYSFGREAERKLRELLDAQEPNAVLTEAVKQEFESALALYNNAIQEDPQFAWPYWGLGDTYQALYVKTKKKEDLEQTISYYRKAYDINPQSAGTNVGLGWAYFLNGDNDAAYPLYKKARELEPDNPVINENIASFYRSILLPVQAIEFYTKALTLGGPDPGTFRLRASCYEHVGRAEEASADARKASEMDPEDLSVRLFYARMLINQQKLEEAQKEITVAEKLNPRASGIAFTSSFLAAARGEKENALTLVKPAEAEPVFYSYLLSRVYAVLGLKDKAIEHIKLGIEKGFPEMLDYMYDYLFLNTNYFFYKLRDDPRFIEILAQQKEKYEEYLKKYGTL
jgi:serine/threonine protein kinase/Flp pilus assembly protein TadD